VLTLDDCVQGTSYDEFLYQEMLTFCALASVADRQKLEVLVVGGGDGGVAREALKDDRVGCVTVVDIDEEVTRTSQKFFPSMGNAFKDQRVNLVIGDAVEYIDKCTATQKKFDVIIIDLTDVALTADDDTNGAERTLNKTTYTKMRNITHHGSIIAEQTYYPYSNNELLKAEMALFQHAVDQIGYATVPVPSFPNGGIGIAFGRVLFHNDSNTQESSSYYNHKDLRIPLYRIDAQRAQQMGLNCYYDKYHEAACVLPLQMELWFQELYGNKDDKKRKRLS